MSNSVTNYLILLLLIIRIRIIMIVIASHGITVSRIIDDWSAVEGDIDWVGDTMCAWNIHYSVLWEWIELNITPLTAQHGHKLQDILELFCVRVWSIPLRLGGHLFKHESHREDGPIFGMISGVKMMTGKYKYRDLIHLMASVPLSFRPAVICSIAPQQDPTEW